MALLLSASCLHGSHAVDVAACCGQGISWYPSHGMQSTLQWGYCSLVCDANHVTWSDQRPATSRGLEIWRPIYGPGAQWGSGHTLQYRSQDNSRVSTDRGSLTHSMRGGAFDSAFKALCASWFASMAALPSGANYSYSANFWLDYSDEYECILSTIWCRIEYKQNTWYSPTILTNQPISIAYNTSHNIWRLLHQE